MRKSRQLLQPEYWLYQPMTENSGRLLTFRIRSSTLGNMPV
jgi:hypothetical protein